MESTAHPEALFGFIALALEKEDREHASPASRPMGAWGFRTIPVLASSPSKAVEAVQRELGERYQVASVISGIQLNEWNQALSELAQAHRVSLLT